jgi:hypothetical protein
MGVAAIQNQLCEHSKNALIVFSERIYTAR